MAKRNNSSDWYDPRRGDHAIRIQNLRLDGKPTDPHEANRTCEFAQGLGAVIVLYGLLLCLHPLLPQTAAVGSFLVFVMSFVTRSFLITTPENWVPALGDAQHGFPYLSGRGRLVIKDAIMMGAAQVTMADSAKAYLRSRSAAQAERSVSAAKTLEAIGR